MKGIDKLIKSLARCDCPSDDGLTDFNRKPDKTLTEKCIYGDGKHEHMCIDCFKQAIEADYREK